MILKYIQVVVFENCIFPWYVLATADNVNDTVIKLAVIEVVILLRPLSFGDDTPAHLQCKVNIPKCTSESLSSSTTYLNSHISDLSSLSCPYDGDWITWMGSEWITTKTSWQTGKNALSDLISIVSTITQWKNDALPVLRKNLEEAPWPSFYCQTDDHCLPIGRKESQLRTY